MTNKTSITTTKEEFEKWAEDYALDYEPLTEESRRADCLAAWIAALATLKNEQL